MLNDKDIVVLNYFTFNKKAHFCSESKLFDALCNAISGVSPYPTVHLTTFPYIAVHISYADKKLINDNEKQFIEVVRNTLEDNLVN